MTPLVSARWLALALAGSLAVVGAAGVHGGAEPPSTGWGAGRAATPATASASASVGLVARQGPVPRVAARGAPARASPSPAASWPRSGVRWQWPLRPRPAVVRPFRAPRSEWGAGHRGLDLAAGTGAPVLAVEAGRVTHAGVVAGRGTVSVTHADGLLSTYEPVRPRVAVGDDVSAGHTLGVMEPGSAMHCGSVGCLHLGARRGDAYLDPWPLLAGGEIALLPLG